MLNEIGVNLITLENEVNTSIQEAHPGQVESENSEYEADQQVCSKRSDHTYEGNDKNDQVQN